MSATIGTLGVLNGSVDDELAGRLAVDLEGTFEEFVVTHQHRIYAFALALTGSRRDAEEVAQDAFVKAHRALSGYPPERVRELRLAAWLHRIALNVFRNRVRGRRLWLVELDGVPAGSEPASPLPGPAELAERTERMEQLAGELAALPPRYREAIVLRCVQDLAYGEAADLLGQPVGTVKSNVSRGLVLLRERLRPRTEVS